MRTWTMSVESVVVLGLTVCVMGADPQARVMYEGAQLLRVDTTSPDHKDKVNELEEKQDVDKWHDGLLDVDLLVTPERLAEVKDTLDKSKVKFDVIIDDVQKAIDTENLLPPQDHVLRQYRQRGHRMSWDYYHRLDDILGYLDYLAQTYPDLVTVQTIGTSVEGRPLKVLKISSGEPNAKAIWIDGGTHAREWISLAAVTYIAHELVENRDKYWDMVRGIDYYILPVVNPDGYEYTHTTDRLWRKNRSRNWKCMGTDLNRNWSYKWGGVGSSPNPCHSNYGGPRAFSEPETAAISRYILDHRDNIKGFLSFHSFGQLILLPWGYTSQLPSDYEDLKTVGHRMAGALLQEGGREYTAGSTASVLYLDSGDAHDWAKGEAGIKYSYTIELPGKTGFILPNDQIVPAAKDALLVVRVLAQAVGNTH